MYINEYLSYKEKTCYASLGVWFYTTIKALKTLKKQVCIIHPSSGTLRVVRSSNLTFGGYLAGTTSVLSIRSSLFVVQVLF